MVETFAPKWTPRGLVQRFREVVREPGDLQLCVHIAAFIHRAPSLIAANELQSFVKSLRLQPAPRGNFERVKRLRTFLLGRRSFARANTCYVRALTLYRYLEAPDASIGLHIGIERRDRASDRLRGHAWVTLDGRMLEGPPAALEGRIREIEFLKAAP